MSKAVDDLQCTRRRRREVTINQMSFWNSPAAAQLFKFWPDSPNLECQVHGLALATANLQLNREDRLLYNNWTRKRTSLLNYMFQLIRNIRAVPTFERHVLGENQST
jgi:hypothetical protein